MFQASFASLLAGACKSCAGPIRSVEAGDVRFTRSFERGQVSKLLLALRFSMYPLPATRESSFVCQFFIAFFIFFFIPLFILL